MVNCQLQSRQVAALGVMIAFVLLAILAVICRFISRRLKRAAIGADDYAIIAGLVLTLATFADSVVRECTRTENAKLCLDFADLTFERGLSRGWKTHIIGTKGKPFSVVQGM